MNKTVKIIIRWLSARKIRNDMTTDMFSFSFIAVAFMSYFKLSLYNACVSGWLLGKQQYKTDVIFNVFDSIWSDLYRYIVQNLNPKMEVS
jgi:antibiotic biosynthesis monooxygenase (ABM) superfamily enzyme